MAGERRNLDKDEAELLKPSSSSSPPPNSAPPKPSATPPSLFLSPPQECSPQMAQILIPDTSRTPALAPGGDAGNADTGFRPPSRGDQQPLAQLKGYEIAPNEPRDRASVPVNRCLACRRKVGLTAYRCRCGELFCGRHRNSNQHDCPFDYKAAARAEIARNNPVVRAAKILKI